MSMLLFIAVIFLVSFILAVRSAQNELEIPAQVKKIKIKKKKGLSGVILFLQKKIIHYSSSDS